MGIWNTNLLTLINVPNMVSLITSARPILKIKLSAGFSGPLDFSRFFNFSIYTLTPA
jgi:hypothetical protein